MASSTMGTPTKSGNVCGRPSFGNEESNQINDKVFVTVVDKTLNSRKNYANFLLLVNNPQSTLVEAKSSREFASTNFNKFEIGCSYYVSGDISELKKKECNRTRTTIDWDYKFNSIDVEREIINPDPGQEMFQDDKALTIAQLKEIASQKEFFKFRLLKGVTLKSGTIYRYVGCSNCSKSNPLHIGKGMHKCTACRTSGKPKQLFANFLIIHGITVADSDGNELKDVVCFNDEAEKLLGKTSKDYVNDNEAEKAFNDLLGSTINMRVSLKKSDYSCLGYDIVADHISIHSRSEVPSTDLQKVNADASAIFHIENLHYKTTNQIDFELKEPVNDGKVLKCNQPYKIESIPRGYVLIINVVNYKDKGYNRESAKWDFLKLFGLFKKCLKFKVFGNNPDEPFNLPDLQSKIEVFKNELKTINIDSCVVIVMGHGVYRKVKLSDGEFYSTDEHIILPFSDDNFPEFASRPKMFMFNTCQTHANDIEGDLKFPNIENAYVTYSTRPGHLSVRTQYGSFFIEILAQVFSQHAKTEYFKDLMETVEQEMKRHKQPFLCNSNPELLTPCKNDPYSFQQYNFVRDHKSGAITVVPEHLLVSELENVYSSIRQSLYGSGRAVQTVQPMETE